MYSVAGTIPLLVKANVPAIAPPHLFHYLAKCAVVVAVECAAADWGTRSDLAKIDHGPTRACSLAEREVLWVLDGHCNSPIAGHAILSGDRISLRAAVISLDGRDMIEATQEGAADRPRELGRSVGLELLDKGAATIIEAAQL